MMKRGKWWMSASLGLSSISLLPDPLEKKSCQKEKLIAVKISLGLIFPSLNGITSMDPYI